MTGLPPTHRPPLQVSVCVQASPSLHETVFAAFTQPIDESHESSVHGFESSQWGEPAPTQMPAWQVSATVHASLSLQPEPSAFAGLAQNASVGAQTMSS